jgi:hypothetical protein
MIKAVYEKMEKAVSLADGLLQEAYSTADALTEIKGAFREIQDNYILLPLEFGKPLIWLLGEIGKYYKDDSKLNDIFERLLANLEATVLAK